MTLSLVVPFYNEGKNIEKVVSGLNRNFEGESIDYKLILVNNGSGDNSPTILESLSKENPDKIKVVHVKVNQGFGWGIISGLRQANGDYIGYMCGDGQTKPEDVVKTYRWVEQGDCDLAKVKRISRGDGLWRRIISFVFNRLFWIMFRVHSLDINGTPKIFNRSWLDKLHLASKDWFIDAEVMIKSRHLGMRIGEVPTEFLPREEGKSHVALATSLEFVKNMLSYRFLGGIKQWKQRI